MNSIDTLRGDSHSLFFQFPALGIPQIINDYLRNARDARGAGTLSFGRPFSRLCAFTGFDFPGPIALTTQGNLAVCDLNNYRVQLLQADGVHIRTISLGSLNYPKSIAVDSFDTLYVSDERGVHLFRDASLLSTLPGISSPLSVAVCKDGSILVLEQPKSGQYNFKHYHSDGTVSSWFPRECARPVSMSINPNTGVIAICDRHSVGVHLYDENFQFLRSLPTPYNTNIAVTDAAGNCAAGDDTCIRLFDSNRVERQLIPIGEYAGGISISEAGNIYVTTLRSSTLLVYAPN